MPALRCAIVRPTVAVDRCSATHRGVPQCRHSYRLLSKALPCAVPALSRLSAVKSPTLVGALRFHSIHCTQRRSVTETRQPRLCAMRCAALRSLHARTSRCVCCCGSGSTRLSLRRMPTQRRRNDSETHKVRLKRPLRPKAFVASSTPQSSLYWPHTACLRQMCLRIACVRRFECGWRVEHSKKVVGPLSRGKRRICRAASACSSAMPCVRKAGAKE